MSSVPQMIPVQNLSTYLKKFNLNHKVVINDTSIGVIGLGSYECLQKNYLGYFIGESLPMDVQLENRTLVVSSNFERSKYSKTNFIVCENPKTAFYIIAQHFKKGFYEYY